MRQSSGKQHTQQHAPGFSLLELLLVLGLLTVAMAITVPALSRWQRRLPLERSAALLQQALAETRLASIQSGEPWGLWLYASGTQGRRTPLNQPDLDRYQFQFPQGIACRPAPVDGQTALSGTEDLVLIFQPDGSSSSARLLLINERGEELHIVLERLSGNAEIRPALSAAERSATIDSLTHRFSAGPVESANLRVSAGRRPIMDTTSTRNTTALFRRHQNSNPGFSC
jgi:type II secretory pathway pseudopilin PulG